jgi:hypothetical protein
MSPSQRERIPMPIENLVDGNQISSLRLSSTMPVDALEEAV